MNTMLKLFFLVSLQWDQVIHKVSDWNYDFYYKYGKV